MRIGIEVIPGHRIEHTVQPLPSGGWQLDGGPNNGNDAAFRWMLQYWLEQAQAPPTPPRCQWDESLRCPYRYPLCTFRTTSRRDQVEILSSNTEPQLMPVADARGQLSLFDRHVVWVDMQTGQQSESNNRPYTRQAITCRTMAVAILKHLQIRSPAKHWRMRLADKRIKSWGEHLITKHDLPSCIFEDPRDDWF